MYHYQFITKSTLKSINNSEHHVQIGQSWGGISGFHALSGHTIFCLQLFSDLESLWTLSFWGWRKHLNKPSWCIAFSNLLLSSVLEIVSVSFSIHGTKYLTYFKSRKVYFGWVSVHGHPPQLLYACDEAGIFWQKDMEESCLPRGNQEAERTSAGEKTHFSGHTLGDLHPPASP